MWNYYCQSVHLVVDRDPCISYLLCAIDSKCDRRDWRAVLRVARHSLGLRATHPSLVCCVLHEANVAGVVLKVQSEDTPLAYVP
jgi:hypothetical protein